MPPSGEDFKGSKREKYHELHDLNENMLDELERDGLATRQVQKKYIAKKLDIEREMGCKKYPGHIYFQWVIWKLIPRKPRFDTPWARRVYVFTINLLSTNFQDTVSSFQLVDKLRLNVMRLDDESIQAIIQVFGRKFFSFLTGAPAFLSDKLKERLLLCFELDKDFDFTGEAVPVIDYSRLITRLDMERAKHDERKDIVSELQQAVDEFNTQMFIRFKDMEDARFDAIFHHSNPVSVFQHHFRFRGVQFGNYVPDTERLWHVRSCYGAFHDLASVLGIDPYVASLGGRLGISIGGRGSGKFAAHFEPAMDVINLTRRQGNGAVAHEWGHFLDHSLLKASTRAVPGLHEPASKYELAGFSYLQECLKDAGPIKIAFKDVESGDHEVRAVERVDGRVFASLPGPEKARITRAIDRHEVLVSSFNQLRHAIIDAAFAKNSRKYGRYWYRPEELFARAFESYVSDRVENPYLAYPTKEHFEHLVFSVYPQGQERDSIDKLFEAFFSNLAGMWDVLFGIQ